MTENTSFTWNRYPDQDSDSALSIHESSVPELICVLVNQVGVCLHCDEAFDTAFGQLPFTIKRK